MTVAVASHRLAPSDAADGFDWDWSRPPLGGPEARRRVLDGIADEVIQQAAQERRAAVQRRLLADIANLAAAAWAGTLTVAQVERLREQLVSDE